MKVNIYIETDNGSRKKMYRGYGAVVEFIRRNGSPETREAYGACYGTWNLAYISALTDALGILTKPCRVTVYAENKFVCESLCSGRLLEWKQDAWHTKKGEPIVNAEGWKALLDVARMHTVSFMYAKKNSYSNYMHSEIEKTKHKGERWRQQMID